MDFELPQPLKLVKTTVRRFVEEEFIPIEMSIPEDSDFPADLRARTEQKVKALGFWASAVPQQFGGAGLGLLGTMVIREEVARTIIGDIRSDRGFGGNPWPILLSCNEAQRAEYLLPTVKGEKTHFFAMTESHTGSDPASMRTHAEQRNGAWVINGSKTFISNVAGAAFGMVFAVTDREKRARGGITCFLVPGDAPGFRIVRAIQTMGAAKVYEIAFENVAVPAENVLGEVGQAFTLAQKTLSATRIGQVPMCLGPAQRALEMSLSYAKQRVTFGEPIADRQAVQFMLADSAAEIHAARLMAHHAAWQYDRGQDIRRESPMVKVFGTEVGSRVLDRAIQIHGAAGLSKDLPLERMYRDIRSFRITEGGSEVQRWVIAREEFRR